MFTRLVSFMVLVLAVVMSGIGWAKDIVTHENGMRIITQQTTSDSDDNQISEHQIQLRPQCDFESSPKVRVQKCFGAIGNQCNDNKPIIHFSRNYITCTASGGMSSASILHDMCCAEHNNECISYGNKWPAGSACLGEWNMALVTTPNKDFKWNGRFGPYYKDNLKSDDISIESIIRKNPAPDGKKVFDPAHCKSKTHSEVKGFIDIPGLGHKPYYICGTKPKQNPQSIPKPKPQSAIH